MYIINASELYNEYLEIYFDQYMILLDTREKMGIKYNPINLFFTGFKMKNQIMQLQEKMIKKNLLIYLTCHP